MNDPDVCTPTADALEAWLAEIERAAAEMDYPGAPDLEDLDPPAWTVEAWPEDNY